MIHQLFSVLPNLKGKFWSQLKGVKRYFVWRGGGGVAMSNINQTC